MKEVFVHCVLLFAVLVNLLPDSKQEAVFEWVFRLSFVGCFLVAGFHILEGW